jgi:raffinose/stachyose/melibiose transport system permease protein
MTRQQKRPLRAGDIIVYLIVVLVLLLFIFPLSYVFITSFKTPVTFLRDPVGIVFTPTLKNFSDAWVKASFGSYSFNSILYTVVTVIVSLLLALLIAFPLARKYIRFHQALFFFLMLGLFLPDGTIPLFQILLKLGLYNTRLGYIISMMGVGGVPLIFFVSYLKGIPVELDEAAIVDGAGYFRYFFKFVIPLAQPAISSMAILQAIGVWNDITRAIIFLSNDKLFPITKGLFVFSGLYSVSWTELTAALVIVAAPLIILYLFLQRYIISGLTASSVKM